MSCVRCGVPRWKRPCCLLRTRLPASVNFRSPRNKKQARAARRLRWRRAAVLCGSGTIGMLKFVHRILHQFINSQSLSGVVLALAAVAALVLSNSPWGEAYNRFVQLPGELRVGGDLLV